VRLCALISAVGVLTAFGSAHPEPGFDPQQVVRAVHTRGGMTGQHPGDLDLVRLHQTIEDRRRPLAADERLGGGPEFLIDTNSVLIPAPGLQNDPAIAFDGANFLIVWEDHRIGSSSGICGARVTPEGTVLDTSGFVISQGTEDRLKPILGFDGENFLVVWQDYRGLWDSDIYGARVTPGGTVLDPSGFAIAQVMNSDQSAPALGFGGENFLVAWEDYRDNRNEPDIYGARVTLAGTVLDSSGFVLTQAANGQYDPAVGFGGKNFLVVWQDRRDTLYSHICGNLVTPEGQVVVPNDFVISYSPSSQGVPALGFDGANFLVSWLDVRGSFPPALSIHGARVTPRGMVLDPDGIVISSTAGTRPVLDSDGANFLVVWEDYRSGDYFDIYGARVTPDGTVLDPQGVGISRATGHQFGPALASDGTNSLVVWEDCRVGAGFTDVYGARVTPEGEVIDPEGFVIPQAARDQFTPALVSDSSNFLAVWEDHRNGVYSDIYGARVTPTGAVLDPDGIAISEAANWQRSPAAGFDGTNFLVVWEDSRGGGLTDIYGTRVTPAGTMLDPDGFVISQAQRQQRSPAVGFDGANFLVVWEDNRGGEHSIDVYGARVTPQGQVLDPGGIAVSEAAGGQYAPAIGFDGANFLVAWSDYRDGGYSDVYGARVTRQGTVLDPEGFVVSSAVREQSSPVLGFDGANFLVAWTDYRSGIYSDIYGARVTPAGTVLDPTGFSIARAAKGQYGPALGLGFDGESFLVVWEDYRSNCPDIYGALVSPDGVAFDTGVVVRQEGNQFFPALALGPDNRLFLVYQGWAGTVRGKTYNTDRIWGKTDPVPGGVEEGFKPQAPSQKPIASIVRGVLFLPERASSSPSTSLLDISGRRVMDLKSGANDVRALAPGVYFVKDAGDEGRTLKVVLQR
jgi:phosphoribosylformylglycinamidine (FGAM) synthase PurS component